MNRSKSLTNLSTSPINLSNLTFLNPRLADGLLSNAKNHMYKL